MSRRSDGRGGPCGLVVVDKAPGPTSHDVVASCRRIFGLSRVGHAGTLDPPASGVLCVALGPATRLLRFIGGGSKSYRCELVLGTSTSTLDDQGEITGQWDMSEVTLDQLNAAAATLRGDIHQVPPMVSAVKVGGRRLHELARAGIEVEREPRAVRVDRLEISGGPPPGVWTMEVTCSAGTYVRVLAEDLGRLVGGGAHLRGLRRLSVGSFSLAEALTLDELTERRETAVLSPAQAMRDLDGVEISAEVAGALRHGVAISPAAGASMGLPTAGHWAALGPDGDLVAVCESLPGGGARPEVVVQGAPPPGHE